jgi:hypothetical protein
MFYPRQPQKAPGSHQKAAVLGLLLHSIQEGRPHLTNPEHLVQEGIAFEYVSEPIQVVPRIDWRGASRQSKLYEEFGQWILVG